MGAGRLEHQRLLRLVLNGRACWFVPYRPVERAWCVARLPGCKDHFNIDSYYQKESIS